MNKMVVAAVLGMLVVNMLSLLTTRVRRNQRT